MPEGNSFGSFLEFYLKESPQLINNMNFIYDDEVSNVEQAQQLVKNHSESKVGMFVYHNIRCHVYLYEKAQNDWFYVLVSENATAVLGVVHFNQQDNTITTSGLWNALMMQGLIFSFFTTYLIKHYKTVISDKITTERGKTFWLKIVDWALRSSIETGIYQIKENTFQPINTIQEAEQVFNKYIEAQNERIYIRIK